MRANKDSVNIYTIAILSETQNISPLRELHLQYNAWQSIFYVFNCGLPRATSCARNDNNFFMLKTFVILSVSEVSQKSKKQK
ncbi:hypothetical protein [Helicobacter sp. T3_23-1059]